MRALDLDDDDEVIIYFTNITLRRYMCLDKYDHACKQDRALLYNRQKLVTQTYRRSFQSCAYKDRFLGCGPAAWYFRRVDKQI